MRRHRHHQRPGTRRAGGWLATDAGPTPVGFLTRLHAACAAHIARQSRPAKASTSAAASLNTPGHLRARTGGLRRTRTRCWFRASPRPDDSPPAGRLGPTPFHPQAWVPFWLAAAFSARSSGPPTARCGFAGLSIQTMWASGSSPSGETTR